VGENFGKKIIVTITTLCTFITSLCCCFFSENCSTLITAS